MRNNYLYTIAGFLIGLIISLPIYSSVVFASLTSPSIKGLDGIEGYIREYDTVTIGVNARTGEEVSGSQVHLDDLSGRRFYTCDDKGDGSFDCSLLVESSSISDTQDVVLYDSHDVYDSSVTLDYVRDVMGPEILMFRADKALVRNGNVNFQYRIKDGIHNGSSRCVGIKEMILTSGAYSRIIPINSGQGNCILQGSISESVDVISKLSLGNVTVEARAYDYFGQESRVSSVSFTVDKEAPRVESLGIFKDGNEIHHFSTAMTVSASVKVSDSSGIASVRGDFGILKGSNGITLQVEQKARPGGFYYPPGHKLCWQSYLGTMPCMIAKGNCRQHSHKAGVWWRASCAAPPTNT